jgi:hypothetical protein
MFSALKVFGEEIWSSGTVLDKFSDSKTLFLKCYSDNKIHDPLAWILFMCSESYVYPSRSFFFSLLPPSLSHEKR